MQPGRTAGPSRSVLIAGAGVAGPALGYWLSQLGYQPTIVERAVQRRADGPMLELWGLGYDLAERMGLVPALRERSHPFESIRFVDAAGRTRSEIGASVLRRSLGERFISVSRGELTQVLLDRVESRAETVFGDSVVGLEEDGHGLDVRFASGPQRHFDLLVGADGLRSTTRTLAMGMEHRWFRYLGYAAATFSVRNYSRRDPSAYVSYASPGRQIGRYVLEGGRTAFLLVFATPEPMALHAGEIETDRRLLRAAFGREAWVEVPEVLQALEDSDDLYYDAVTQLELPAWWKGRTVLVGDAAYSPSLLGGAGAALSMLGAFILARELAGSDQHSIAFARYEQRLRPFIERRQRTVRAFAAQFVPRSQLGLTARALGIELMRVPKLGGWITRRLFEHDFEVPISNGGLPGNSGRAELV